MPSQPFPWSRRPWSVLRWSVKVCWSPGSPVVLFLLSGGSLGSHELVFVGSLLPLASLSIPCLLQDMWASLLLFICLFGVDVKPLVLVRSWVILVRSLLLDVFTSLAHEVADKHVADHVITGELWFRLLYDGTNVLYYFTKAHHSLNTSLFSAQLLP